MKHFGKKLHVSAIVRRDADSLHVFLDRRASDVARGPVKAQINDLDAMTDQLEIDRDDRAVMAIAYRNCGQDTHSSTAKFRGTRQSGASRVRFHSESWKSLNQCLL